MRSQFDYDESYIHQQGRAVWIQRFGEARVALKALLMDMKVNDLNVNAALPSEKESVQKALETLEAGLVPVSVGDLLNVARQKAEKRREAFQADKAKLEHARQQRQS